MSSRISELAALVSSNTDRVNHYLASKALPSPSFDENGPVDLKLSPEIEQARIAAIDASTELQALLLGPIDLLRPIINATSLQAIYKYNIASKVPLGGEISFVDLAKLCDMYEPDLRRIVRFAIAYHYVFKEPRKGFVAHSAASRRLVDDEGARDGLGLMFDDCWQSFARTVEATEKFKSQDPAETGWALAHDGMPLYQSIGSNPAKAKRFASAMKSFSSSDGMSASFVVKSFDWASIGDGTVVDLGGSHGQLCIAVAESFPNLKFIVQELPRMVQSVDKSAIPSTVADRIEFMEHDFFTPQSVKANVYVLRQVFHNYPDGHVIKILRQLIPALDPGARILVNDYVLAEPGKTPLSKEKYMRAMDMLMLTLCNSRERDRDDWAQIFQEADARFKFVDAYTPEGSVLGIAEAIWQPDSP